MHSASNGDGEPRLRQVLTVLCLLLLAAAGCGDADPDADLDDPENRTEITAQAIGADDVDRHADGVFYDPRHPAYDSPYPVPHTGWVHSSTLESLLLLSDLFNPLDVFPEAPVGDALAYATDGRLNGQFAFWNEHGDKLMEGRFTEGMAEGRWVAWNEEGSRLELVLATTNHVEFDWSASAAGESVTPRPEPATVELDVDAANSIDAAPERERAVVARSTAPVPRDGLRASSAEGSLTVRAQPGSLILLDGADVGTTNDAGVLVISGVQAGRHLVGARKAGYADVTRTMTVVAERSELVELASAELPGILTVTANTDGVTLQIDGVGTRSLPVTALEIPAGARRMIASRPGFRTLDNNVEIRPGETTTLELSLVLIPLDEQMSTAETLLRSGDHNAAIAAAGIVMNEYPEEGAPHLFVGYALYSLGHFADSVVPLTWAIALGGEVELPARHRHGGLGLRVNSCDGVITLSSSSVTFRSSSGNDHSFHATPENILSLETTPDRIDTRILVVEGDEKRERSFDFVHTSADRVTDNVGLFSTLSCVDCDGSLGVLAQLLKSVRGF